VPIRPKLLVVDDDVINIQIINAAFAIDHQVFSATSGEAALKQCAMVLPDVVLLDISMPTMDGFMVCQQLKANPALRDIPVIFITSHDDEANEVRALDDGAADFIAKPIKPKTLRARVGTQLALQSKHRQLQEEIATREVAQKALEESRRELMLSNAELLETKARLKKTIVDMSWQAVFLEAIIDNVPVALFAKDVRDNFRITLWNKAAEEIFKIPRHVVMGKLTHDLWPKEQADAFLADDQRVVRENKAVDIPEELVRTGDGSNVVMHTKKVLIHSPADSQPELLLGLCEDITIRKATQTQLFEANRELSRSNADLEQFAYAASHDLMEPLRSISSCVQLLQKRYAGKLDARADEFISHAVSGAARMQTLIQDLLAFSRINSGSMEHRALSMESALADACKNLQAAITQSNAQITHDPLPSVNAHSSQIAQLLQNLLANAIKFRGDKPAIVHVRAIQEGEQWIFSVADQGIGIEPQYFSRVFEIFKRLHTITEYAGTGIGLALCKSIAERHGGRIWVESELGQGTTFFFALPVIPELHELPK
jgi:PAS domain S-box-containing protein